jgi:hypothetical protein
VRLLTGQEGRIFSSLRGEAGSGAVYLDSGGDSNRRRILLRISAKLDWLILKLH